MSDSIVTAAIEHCWQEEQLAHADWFYGHTEAQRADLTDDPDKPWRSIMRTSARRLIGALEAAGLYDASILTDPRARARKPNVYRQSPYDYEVARRVEGEFAEGLWAKGARD